VGHSLTDLIFMRGPGWGLKPELSLLADALGEYRHEPVGFHNIEMAPEMSARFLELAAVRQPDFGGACFGDGKINDGDHCC
jgi:hypothetical protein